jgi:hypothetical protein
LVLSPRIVKERLPLAPVLTARISPCLGQPESELGKIGSGLEWPLFHCHFCYEYQVTLVPTAYLPRFMFSQRRTTNRVVGQGASRQCPPNSRKLLSHLYFGWWLSKPELDLLLLFVSIGITTTIVAYLIARQNAQFISLLIWGSYISLMLLMLSDNWVWELAESYPVLPVAQIVQLHTPPGQVIFTSNPIDRISLSFYSDRRVISAPDDVKKRWQQGKTYLLLKQEDLNTLPVQKYQPKILGSAEEWILVTQAE